MGFPSTVPQCSTDGCGTREVGTGKQSDRLRTRIIPEMSFTCSGTVTHWRAAGVFRHSDDGNAIINSALSIWRERSGQSGTYDRMNMEIQLGSCGGEDLEVSMSNVYECALGPSEMVSVQSGDIIGIELPASNRAKFRLHFYATNSGPTNYVFHSQGSSFSLSEAISTQQDQPQISLTVVPDIPIITVPVFPTGIQPLTTTEASPTDPPITQPLTSTEAITTTTITEPPTTTEASSTTAATVMQPSTITGASTTATEATRTADTESTDPTTVNTLTSMDISTATEATDTTDSIMSEITPVTSSMNEAIHQLNNNKHNINIETIAGAAVGGIIAILLILIIVLLLVLVLRRQSRNGKKITPSNNSTSINPAYNGKPIVPNLEDIFHLKFVMNIILLFP